MHTPQVIKLDLQQNGLKTIPKFLLELPNLEELNLSRNRLVEIPDVSKWSCSLTNLDLSDNNLFSLPSGAVASSLHSLNLSKNKFHTVPLCICSFTTLHSLNLSGNPDIVFLPVQMGRLNHLSYLALEGLKSLKDPPKYVQKDCRECIRYLFSKLRNVKGFYRMKLMVVGHANRGKSTLVARLEGKEHGHESVVGLHIREWCYRPSAGRRTFYFDIWDFGGQEEYYATHQCFLSQNSMYLVLFNLTHRDKGVEEVRFWLNDLAYRAPQSCVIIVGTHLDEIANEDRGPGGTDVLLHCIGSLAAMYKSKLRIVEILPVALEKQAENIVLLKEAIYNHAAKYKNRDGQPIMGQNIPGSYHTLYKELETIKEEVKQGQRIPVMHVEEFRAWVDQVSLGDIHHDEEIKEVTLFLTDFGSIVHFDDRGHNLHELYFVDPCWLFDVMSKFVLNRRNQLVRNSILNFKELSSVIEDIRFPWQYTEQFIALLDHFEIALPLNNRQLLIPSTLLHTGHQQCDDEREDLELVYSRILSFSSTTPPGFWSRLLSQIMYCMPKVCCALNKLSSVNDQEPSPDMTNSDCMCSRVLTPIRYNITSLSFYTATSRHLSDERLLTQAPEVIPNFPDHILPDVDSVGVEDVHLEYWHTGLYYRDSEVKFRIVGPPIGCEPLTGNPQDSVFIAASHNCVGKKILSQLVDIVMSLIDKWYPALIEDKHGSTGIKQNVPCFECMKLKRPNPYKFRIEQCIAAIVNNKVSVKCGYFCNDEVRNHFVALEDIVPDMLLKDMNSDLLLTTEDVSYQKDEHSLLGTGGYAKVYRGWFKGSKPVAIKKCLSHQSSDALSELRSEVIIHYQLNHPCIVNLVGVCVQPAMVLVFEEAPLNSASHPLLRQDYPIHRLTTFRIAAEVAAALQYMHSRGIMYRDVKAGNVLLWTLDPESLCHCKLCDFGLSTRLSPIGTRGMQGCKGFIAPEVLYIGNRKQRSVYDHRADVFSFGILLYQMIARRHPYHNIPPYKIDAAVERGERPELQDVPIAQTGYYYLTQLMKACWDDNPQKRPAVEDIIRTVCLSSMQMVMSVAPIQNKHSPRQAIAITSSDFLNSGYSSKLQSELWVYCDCVEGVEVSTYNIHTMNDVKKIHIKDSQVQCMALCGSHVWIASRAGIEYGAINIYDVDTKDLVHNIHMQENTISCIAVADKTVYVGTLEGYCICFQNDISGLKSNAIQPKYKYISEYPVNGIVCTKEDIWISYAQYICCLDFETLAIRGTIHREIGHKIYNVGKLALDLECVVVWSAHIGGVMLSAWDVHHKCHLYDVNAGEHLKRISRDIKDHDLIISAMTPALDTVWVGMASGHILTFHYDQLLSWYHPFEHNVHFLTCISSSGPCGTEKCMIASGGRNLMPLVPLPKPSHGIEVSASHQGSSLIVWEAYDACTMKQVKLIEERAPGFLDSHESVCRMIREGGFRDGTHLCSFPDSDAKQSVTQDNGTISTLSQDKIINELCDDLLHDQTLVLPLKGTKSIHPSQHSEIKDPEGEFGFNLSQENSTVGTTEGSVTKISSVSATRAAEEEIKLSIQLPNHEESLKLTFSKPVQLDSVMNEVHLMANLLSEQKWQLTYSVDGSFINIETQEMLERYLVTPCKPPLVLQVITMS